MLAALEKNAEEGFKRWLVGATDAQKAQGKKELDDWNDPEYAAAEMAKFEQKFHAADANKDGVLDLAEYTVLMKGEQEAGRARGNWEDERPEFY